MEYGIEMLKTSVKNKIITSLLWSLFIAVFICFLCDIKNNTLYGNASWQSLFFLVVSFFVLAYMLFGAICAYLYKPAVTLSDEQLPGCTVLVPAYNEGKHVAETLFSLFDSDYPVEKLQIIAINDGSQDDTLFWIRSAEEKSSGRLQVIDLQKNGGKKHALYCGILRAEHDIIVTVDSDSIVTPESLRNMVSAFQGNDIGAVAGNIRIKNLEGGMIPRMMDVGFMFGFEIIRSAQSILGCVMCTPGALSAYRKSLILPFLDQWLHQRFLGTPATIGEDRAIATMILQHGYRIVFQHNAVAFTCIPDTYVRFCKMLLRWLRSDVRENYLIACHGAKVFQPFRLKYWGFVFHLIFQILSTVFPIIALPVLFRMCMTMPLTEVWHSLYYSTGIGFISALIPAMIYAVRISPLNAVWALVYSVYNAVLLVWIPIYALFTVRNTRWLTRELGSGKTAMPSGGITSTEIR